MQEEVCKKSPVCTDNLLRSHCSVQQASVEWCRFGSTCEAAVAAQHVRVLSHRLNCSLNALELLNPFTLCFTTLLGHPTADTWVLC